MTGLPTLWLYGPSGVGKTTVGWELFTALAREGTPTGYVDTDQLSMCYGPPTPQRWAPEPASDPGRYGLRAANLDAVVANMHAAGAARLVVSGIVDGTRGVRADPVPHAELTPCRLRAEPAELARRIAARGSPADLVEQILGEAEALDRLPGAVVETTGLGAATIARLVRDRWTVHSGQTEAPPRRGPSRSDGTIVWLCGPTAVGKSTVGWQVYQRLRHAGYSAAYVDVDQLGFRRPVPPDDPGNHRLRAANLASVWEAFRARGADCLVAVGPVRDPAPYLAALPAASPTLYRLHAGPARLAERIALRGKGIGPGWGIPGDELVGRSEAVLRSVLDDAVAQSRALDGTGVPVDTDGREPARIADEILARAAPVLPTPRAPRR